MLTVGQEVMLPVKLAFLVDIRDTFTLVQASQEIPSPTAFQTNDLDAFDSDCDDAPSSKKFSLLIFPLITQITKETLDLAKEKNNNCLDNNNLALELLKIESDRLIELLISQDLMHTAINSIASINDYKSMEQSFLHEYEENLKLQTELEKKNDMIEKELLVYFSAPCPSLKHVSNKLVDVTPINRTRKVRSNTKKDMITQTSSSNKKKNKVEDHPRIVKSSLNNMNHVSKPVWNTNFKLFVLNANSELICATCHECMFDDIQCVCDYLNDVNGHVKSKSVKSRSSKSKKKKMWKPTSKVYTNVGYC
nr:hypothetical protein [Tanacetum cinerariifolium]